MHPLSRALALPACATLLCFATVCCGVTVSSGHGSGAAAGAGGAGSGGGSTSSAGDTSSNTGVFKGCFNCAGAALCGKESEVCPSSLLTWQALRACACSTTCAGPCSVDSDACGPSCIVTDACSKCANAQCGMELSACEADP